MISGDEVVVLDHDRRRGLVVHIDLTRKPGPTIRVVFEDGKLPDMGWYYETNLARLRPVMFEAPFKEVP